MSKDGFKISRIVQVLLDKVVTWAQAVQTGAKEIQKGTISADHVSVVYDRSIVK
jgi:hypothetical protein